MPAKIYPDKTPKEEAILLLHAGWNVLLAEAQLIAELPLEKWLDDFEKAEAVAPILDPTLYRDYLYSAKGDVLKSIIRAALPLKKAIIEAREQALKQRQPTESVTSDSPESIESTRKKGVR